MKVSLIFFVIVASLFLIGFGLYNHESLGYVCGWIVALISNLQLLAHELNK